MSAQDVYDLFDATNLLASGKVLALIDWDPETARAARGLRARVVVVDGPEEARRAGYATAPLAEALREAELVVGDVDATLLREGAVVIGTRLDGDEVRAGVVEHVRADGTSVFAVTSQPRGL